MTTRKIYLSSFIFSSTSGIINIVGIKQIGVVLTNVTGHISSLVQQIGDGKWEKLELTFSYAFVYWLGAFVASSCFTKSEYSSVNYWKSVPLLLNFGILFYAIISHTIPAWGLIWVASSQNTFGTYQSKGEIRPSQITGVVMALGSEVSNFLWAKNSPTAQRKIGVSINTKLLNIIGFIAGGCIAMGYSSSNILVLPALFYLINLLHNIKNTVN